MKATYSELRNTARKIVAALPQPAFYTLFQEEIARSKRLFYSHHLLKELKDQIAPLIDDDFGHGMLHSELVAIDGGAIVQIEMGLDPGTPEMVRTMVLVQVAGLLHDIRRKEKSHAQKGAAVAEKLLLTGGYGLTQREIKVVCNAIDNHEAFQAKPQPSPLPESLASPWALGTATTPEYQAIAQLVSDALYDADKFRWGPDNFTHTVWDMVMFANIPLSEFLRRFPAGMQGLAQIKNTFRTETGKTHGPGFIDLGLETGKRLLAQLKADHLELFNSGPVSFDAQNRGIKYQG
ncbi:MAG: hypothetical protein RBR67_14510 [Desulfobacterium sp.]|nr:hypothetical protein [Desulfobacterium sp.]